MPSATVQEAERRILPQLHVFKRNRPQAWKPLIVFGLITLDGLVTDADAREAMWRLIDSGHIELTRTREIQLVPDA